jgi:hypothetical protein
MIPTVLRLTCAEVLASEVFVLALITFLHLVAQS